MTETITPATESEVITIMVDARTLGDKIETDPLAGAQFDAEDQMIEAGKARYWNQVQTSLSSPGRGADIVPAKRAIDANGHRLLVIALVTTGAKAAGTFAGLYAVIEDGAEASGEGGGGEGGGDAAAHHRAESPSGGGARRGATASLRLATRVMGAGPPVLTSAMVHTLFKYDTAAREFKEVGRSGTFTPTVDAVGVDSVHYIVARSGNGTILVSRE